MKQILLLAFIFYSMSLSAQSLIVTTSGQPITGYDVTVTPNGVFYRSSESSEAQFLKIATDSVLLVRHSDGTIVNVAEQSTTTPSASHNAPVSDTPQTADLNDYLDHEYNKAMIAKYNTPAEIVVENGKGNTKNNSISFQHYAAEDSQFATNDLIVKCHFYSKYSQYLTDDRNLLILNGIKVHGLVPLISISLENISNRTIYIDLANTFLIRNGESEPYYVPGATSTTGGGTTGTSVNLGGVVKAAGIGGPAGAIAGAVNVNNSRSNFTTNTTYSQRVIAIPPYSTLSLDEKLYILYNNNNFVIDKVRLRAGDPKRMCFTYCISDDSKYTDDKIEWDEDNTPQKRSCFLTYSFSEDISNSRNVRLSLYIKRGVSHEINYLQPIPKMNSIVENISSGFYLKKLE